MLAVLHHPALKEQAQRTRRDADLLEACGGRVERTLTSTGMPLPPALAAIGAAPSQLTSRNRTVWVSSASRGPTTTRPAR